LKIELNVKSTIKKAMTGLNKLYAGHMDGTLAISQSTAGINPAVNKTPVDYHFRKTNSNYM
jgi:hypothetical protein